MKIVAYYRVSTRRQGRSGLGLDAQREAVQRLARERGATIMAEYTEVESGRKSDRPELARALAHAKLAKATLIVAKLDRLSRNVAFLSAVLDSGAEFMAVDMPAANRPMLQMMTVMAEHEATMASARTTAAIAAAKRRGVQLGSARPGHWDGREKQRAKGLRKAQANAAVARTAIARDAYATLLPLMKEKRDEGATLAEIAECLNDQGMPTRGGKSWTPCTVQRVLLRG